MTQQASAPRLRPVIRVFVSSTFSDMKHERNALEAEAFPKLEQLCQRQGFQFQAIDLRFLLRQGYDETRPVSSTPQGVSGRWRTRGFTCSPL